MGGIHSTAMFTPIAIGTRVPKTVLRFRRLILLVLALVWASALAPWLDAGIAAAQAPPSAPKAQEVPPHPRHLGDLIEGGAIYDGKQVTVEGEVLGDVMIRDSCGWINISDGSAVIGVWGPSSLMSKVRLAGTYKTHGDRVRIQGVFRRSDPEQGGEMDIRASSLEVVSRGRAVDHPVTPAQIARAVASLLVAIALGLVWRARVISLG